MTSWRRISTPQLGFLDSVSESVGILQQRLPNLITDLSDRDMWIGSDYSGHHRGAAYETYCFVVACAESVGDWDRARAVVRSNHLRDDRCMAFKSLRDSVRATALPHFLGAADRLRGNLVCFLVDRRIESLFKPSGLCTAEEMPEFFSPETKPHTIEKMLRVGSFIALLIATLRSQDRRTLWISDRDEALEHYVRREELGRLISVLVLGMTRWQSPGMIEFGTTVQSPGSEALFEDFAAIPDLVAGALGNAAIHLPTYAGERSWSRTVNRSSIQDRRSRVILDWLCHSETLLSRVMVRMDLDSDSKVRVSAQAFPGSAESLSSAK